MRILLVEDEQKIADFMRKGLKAAGYAIDHAKDGDEGLEFSQNFEYDVLIIDVMLPGIEGINLLTKIRKSHPSIPALIVSARGNPEDKIKGLDAGADDYLSKPFDFGELLARLRALMRKQNRGTNYLQCGDLVLDPLKRIAHRKDKKIVLSNKEYALLEYLVRHQNQVLSKTQILNHVWQLEFDPGTNVVEVYIRYLRDKIDRDFEFPYIHTQRGTGYILAEAYPF